jgi:hypothetical protein
MPESNWVVVTIDLDDDWAADHHDGWSVPFWRDLGIVVGVWGGLALGAALLVRRLFRG